MSPQIPPSDSPLRSPAEFDRLRAADPAFRAFAAQVYDYLDRMKPGHRLLLTRYDEQRRAWIVQTACAFIAEGGHALEYRFSDDWTAIHRDPLPSHVARLVERHRLRRAGLLPDDDDEAP